MISIEELYKIFSKHPSVQTDTRRLRKGDLFFALKGNQFNGNAFAVQAISEGAAYAVVDEEVSSDFPNRLIRVDHVLETLQALAQYHRQQFQIPFLAITGSNGKTTSKELIHAVLASTYTTYTTQGNLNNHIGIPLTILNIKKDAQIAVIEMGANHIGEIAGYCRYCLPTHGIITNCGKAHLEGFGSVEGVRKAKGELYDFIRATGGTAFVMWDYDYLRQMSKGISHIVRYGSRGDLINGTVHENWPFLSVDINGRMKKMRVNSRLVGEYNFPNILLAACVGNYFNVGAAEIKSSIERYSPSNSRSQLIKNGSNKIILDAYNANPSSMKAAIENLAKVKARDKMLILGAMAELGKDSMREHQDIINLIADHPWKEVVLVGGDFQKLKHPYKKFVNATEARNWFRKQKIRSSYVLIKGSRSMQMEKVIEP